MPDLQAIVQKMIDAGEPEENIATVIKAQRQPTLQKVDPSEPDTYLGGFMKSAGQTVGQTARGIGSGVLSALNPANLVRGPYELGKDIITNQGQGTMAGLQAIASGDPEASGRAIGGLATALAVPRLPFRKLQVPKLGQVVDTPTPRPSVSPPGNFSEGEIIPEQMRVPPGQYTGPQTLRPMQALPNAPERLALPPSKVFHYGPQTATQAQLLQTEAPQLSENLINQLLKSPALGRFIGNQQGYGQLSALGIPARYGVAAWAGKQMGLPSWAGPAAMGAVDVGRQLQPSDAIRAAIMSTMAAKQ